MAISLQNAQDAFDISLTSWGTLLDLGRMHGWQPAGTEAPQWDDPAVQATVGQENGICTSVSGADAQALANALERALSKMPDHKLSSQQSSAPETTRAPRHLRGRARPAAAWRAHRTTDPQPAGLLAGAQRRQLRQFVAFARQGRFIIRWTGAL